MHKNKCLEVLVINGNVMEKKIPLKVKNLKVIDYLGTLYATFDGSSMWEMDKAIFIVLKRCDGKKTVNQIVEEISERIDEKQEAVKPIVENMLKELKRMNFIEWV